jgi:hypothetical protein
VVDQIRVGGGGPE